MDERQPIKENRNWEAKLARLRAGTSLRVIDLFAGCGGMSLGMQRAEYEILGGLELDPNAALTHATNFFSGTDEETFKHHSTARDITELTPQQFMQQVLRAEDPANLVDVIVGGPPCQAFARVGRAKLGTLAQNPDAFLTDERASLYLRYLTYVAYFQPLAVIIENVPDIMNFGGRNIAEEIAASLRELGYHCSYTILNSAHYGVPQLRHRFYLIAILDSLDVAPSFPTPTHFIELPSGYVNIHNFALGANRNRRNRTPGTTQLELLQQHPLRYIAPPDANCKLPPAITAHQALSDLPEITRGTIRRGAKKFDHVVRYRRQRPSNYSRDMREWVNFEADGGLSDHVTRCLPRDFPIFALMQPGDEYPRAHELAMGLFYQALADYERLTGLPLSEDSEEYKQLKKGIVPPYATNKFPNKWWKIKPDEPVRTLTAHIGNDTYTHIHYDSDQARVISVREAARLQSFPDGFKFIGPMSPAFKQIGNSVPPLQAYELGCHIQNLLRRAAVHRLVIILNTGDRNPVLEPVLHESAIEASEWQPVL